MGSGKSTHGKKLALLANASFIDLDRFIEEKEKSTVSQIFLQNGEQYFRKLEKECLEEIVAQPKSLVVSLGGGTLCFLNNLDLVKQNGLLIYIEMSANALYKRISESGQQRPLLNNLKGEALLKCIEELLASRKKYYGQSHFTVNGLNLTAQELYLGIVEFRKKNNL